MLSQRLRLFEPHPQHDLGSFVCVSVEEDTHVSRTHEAVTVADVLFSAHLLKDGSDVPERGPALTVLGRTDLLIRLVCVKTIVEALYLWKPLSSVSAFVLSQLKGVWVDILLVFNGDAALE